MLRTLGADAVTMSTVPEAIMGKYLGLEVVALSLVSNIAAGLVASPLDHADVLATGSRCQDSFRRLALALIERW